MTLPFERNHAVSNVRDFLYMLMDSKQTPRVPKHIRTRARQLLKHYPTNYDMERACEKSPEIFGRMTNKWF